MQSPVVQILLQLSTDDLHAPTLLARKSVSVEIYEILHILDLTNEKKEVFKRNKAFLT